MSLKFVKTRDIDCKDKQCHYPRGITVGIDDVIYIADSGNHRIQCFDSMGNFIRKWGHEGSGDGEFIYPVGLAMGALMYDGMKQSTRIMKEMISVQELALFPPGVLPLCMSFIGDDELLYVCDTDNNRIQVFQYDGKFIRKWGSKGARNGQFTHPYDCSVSIGGMVYVADTHNHRIQKFDSEGKFIQKWGSARGSGDGQFDNPYGVCVSGDGLIYIADRGNCRIQCMDKNGKFIRKWGSYGTGNGQFDTLRGVVVSDDAANGVPIVYTIDNFLQAFLEDGTFISRYGITGSADMKFDIITAITIVPNRRSKLDENDKRDIVYVCHGANKQTVIECYFE